MNTLHAIKETETEYVPFGPEWEKELMKLPKKAIIDLYRRNAQELIALKEKIESGEQPKAK